MKICSTLVDIVNTGDMFYCSEQNSFRDYGPPDIVYKIESLDLFNNIAYCRYTLCYDVDKEIRIKNLSENKRYLTSGATITVSSILSRKSVYKITLDEN